MDITLQCKHNVNTASYLLRKHFLFFLILSLSAIPPMLIFCIVTSFKELTFSITIIVVCFLMWGLFYLLFRKNAKKAIEKSFSANFDYCIHTFTEKGMELKSFNYLGGINAYIPYSSFKKVFFDKKNLFLRDDTSILYFLSRTDIEPTKEAELIELFNRVFSKEVFDCTKIVAKKGSASPIKLASYTPPIFSMPELRIAPHSFDSEAESYFKRLRFSRTAKHTNPIVRLIVCTLIPLVVAIILLIMYIVDNTAVDLLQVAFAMLWFVMMIIPIFVVSLRSIKAKDPYGRDRQNVSVEISVNEYYVEYKVVSGNQYLCFYNALSEAQFIRETINYFALYIGILQPLLINKKHLTGEQIQLLQIIINSKYAYKYSYFNI